MPIDPIFQAALDAARNAGAPGLSEGTIGQFRSVLDASAEALGKGPEIGGLKDFQIPGRSGPIASTLYLPVGPPDGIAVYLHGGGWIGGSRAGYEQLCRQLVSLASYAILFVDYRLAPEHPFPAATEDVQDVLKWIAESSMARGVMPVGSDVVIAGDSAGANLAVVASTEWRGSLNIARLVLFYPVTDCDFETQSYRELGQDLNMTRRDMQWFFENYAPRDKWIDPKISPLRGSLAGAPPTWIGLAEYDVLLSEGQALAERLRQFGVDAQSIVYEGTLHGFARWFNISQTAMRATRDASAAIRGVASL
ncbi:alpha/beta hydrolase [Bradyrhizobium sp. UNPF46]|uniref:alpha/beta hydrolase n=1 Tax=Bradyrhizobium sp. UNPF46 TaxID=1141168 RepID=UPI00114F5424|nr:alpha/beta hydrolase [Bradyrhizobium sp. UNPF46]